MSQYHTQQQYAAYKTAHHTTENKTQQIVMIYDGLMRIIYQAKQAISDNNIQERFNLLEKTSQVILALQASLDFENGGELAKILDSYYDSIYTKVHLINQSNNPSDCDSLIEDIRGMRGSWQYVLETTANSNGNIKAPTDKPAAPSASMQSSSSLQVSI
jgi:flagellar protein FliS